MLSLTVPPGPTHCDSVASDTVNEHLCIDMKTHQVQHSAIRLTGVREDQSVVILTSTKHESDSNQQCALSLAILDSDTLVSSSRGPERIGIRAEDPSTHTLIGAGGREKKFSTG